MQKMYTVFDAKADVFMQPFFAISNGMAVRMFTDVVNESGTAFNKHSLDFSLYELGEWDEQTANFVALLAPVQLVTGKDVRVVEAGPDLKLIEKGK